MDGVSTGKITDIAGEADAAAVASELQDFKAKEVNVPFATQNWRQAVVDKTRTGQFVRKHFEAMVFTALTEERRTGDIAVVGSVEYADWSEQLLARKVQEALGSYLGGGRPV
ncbi:hypothetical protein ACIQNI_28665 [Streptomyces sp. NPDC091266]|uniref:hypothetical protein n=1 Tax=Streptomyces sp. NPDC091266 TaxID=3365978 RepID=UPI0038159454